MTAIITTGNYPKALWPGVNTFWGMSYKLWNDGAQWREIFEVSPSEKNYEEDVSTVGMGLAKVKAEGDATEYDTMKQGYLSRYTHVTYATGFIVTQEELEDNLYAKLAAGRTISMAQAVKRTEEIVAANILNRAFNPSYTYGDGVSLINANHPLDTGATFSNTLPYSADLSEAALEQAIIDINGFTDPRGNIIALQPRKLIIPRQLRFQAPRLLENPNRPETANRDINIINKHDLFPEGYAVNNYLQLPTAWFILTDALDGFKRFDRVATKITQDNDFDTDNFKCKCRLRFSVGVTDSGRAVYAAQGAI